MTEMMKVPFFKGTYGEEEVEAVRRVLQSGWLTSGPVVKELEEAVAEYTKSGNAVAVNSCTAAMTLALKAKMPRTAWKAVVPAWTFLATAGAVENAGGECVFVDSDPETLNMDLDALDRACANFQPDAIVPVHFNGNPVDMNAVMEIAVRHKVGFVLEDCAHAFGTAIGVSHHGAEGAMFGPILKHAGTFGHAGAFSFYTTKNLSCGEGGMLVTDDPRLAETVRTYARFGQPRAAIERLDKGQWHKPDQATWGTKANLSDVLAAVGVEQLRKFPAMREARIRLAADYDAALVTANHRLGFDAFVPVKRSASACPHMMPLVLDRRLDRDGVARFMVDRGVQVQVHYKPVPWHPWWRERYDAPLDDLPVCKDLMTRVLSVPFWPGMSPDELQYVCGKLEEAAGGRP